MSDVGCRMSEDGGRMSNVGGRKSEDGSNGEVLVVCNPDLL